MTDHYDVIVIGSGAGGGTLTHALAPTGKRILLLERGDFLPREPPRCCSPRPANGIPPAWATPPAWWAAT
jgi:choline dehydrogenase-like flavoprotein